MPLIWFLIDDETRERLRKYQWRWHRKKLVPPNDNNQPWRAQGELEGVEEIDRIMRQPPGPKWRGNAPMR